jgi:hypothetical protein
MRQMHSLLKKKKMKDEAHKYKRWVKLREVQNPLLRRARKRKNPITIPIFGKVTTTAAAT